MSFLRVRRLFFALLVAGNATCPAEHAPTHTAFAAASVREGSTLFTALAPERTGLVVDNRYDDPQMWSTRYRAFMGGSMGSGVAAGDFDGDGLVDLYVCTKTKPGRLFKNLGGWKFKDVTDAAGLGEGGSLLSWVSSAVSSTKDVIWRQGAVFADVNNDGHLDLFICRNNAENLLYINQGDGTFKEEASQRGLALIDGSVVGAFADYDRDGWLDVLVVANQMEGTEPTGRSDHLFRNVGKGYFTEVTQGSGIAAKNFGHAATWLDYDGDGWPDLYIDNDFSGPDALYRNHHDGTFSNVLDAAVPHTPYSSMGLDTADVDNDGHPDLMIADMATTTREKNQRGLAASRGDVLMMGTKEGTAPQYMRNALLLNTGRGVFREAACWAGVDATDWTWSLRFEDFDNDGWLDLHVTNGMVREANNSDVLFNMMGALSDFERIGVMKKSPILAEPNLAYRNRRGTGFEAVTGAWGLGEAGVSFGAATADLDNDGDLDLVYLNYDAGLSVFRNDIAGQHRIQIRLQGTKSNRFGVGAVVRLESGDGPQSRVMTVARGYSSGSELVAHFGLGAQTEASRIAVEWPSGITQTVEHLPADQAYTLVEAETNTTVASAPLPTVFEDRTARFGLELKDASALAAPDDEQPFLPFRTDRQGPGVAVGDIDGDGREDLYLAATTGSPARVLRSSGTTYLAEAPNGLPSAAATEEGPPLLFDADGNGTLDLLVTKASARAGAWPQAFQPQLFSNDGEGGFTPTSWLPTVTINVGAACAADIDGDGKLDLFLGGRSVPGRYPEAPQSFVLHSEKGGFVDVTERTPGLKNVGLVKSALFRDVDRDGLPDLVIALEWDFVRYFHNEGEGRFVDATERSGFATGGRGWWNSLASADLNGDGRLDFVVGNAGLNTTYKASTENPATLFYGDFAQNGTALLAEGVYDGPKLYPLRAKADLGKRLPFVLRKFPKTDAFARADMTAIFGTRTLADAKVFRATNLSSGVFLSQPDGTYRFSSLPPVAQIGPIQGVVAADFDGDGHADVGAVQNSDVAVPRFDGGVGIFLHGKGDGTFDALEPARSGVVVPGNGRALVLLDPTGSGRPGLFLTRQSGTTVFLENTTSPTRRWLTVRLHGAGTNTQAIGAQVEIVYSARPRAYFEIAAGGGWQSQSGTCLPVALPDDETVVEAIVRWPNGVVSHYPCHSHSGAWEIRQAEQP